jgi:DNA-binding transcriptional MerR regulator
LQSALDSGLLSRVYAANMHSISTYSALQIGEVAKLTALSVDAIRFYERSSLLPEVPRTPGRFRLFTHADIARLSFIRKMQNLGFSLREVRQILDLRENRLDACKEVSELVKTKLTEVRSKIRELQKLEAELAAGLRKCNAERRHRSKNRSCPVLELTSAAAKEHSC